MPIYEYECNHCGEHFEAIQSFSDKPLDKCEKCGGPVTKLISQSSFHLKGSGWYVTDYSSSKRPGSKPVEGKPSTPATEPAKPSSTSD